MALPLYAVIRKEITGKIADGSWPPGTRIPSEAELSRQYRCSRGTVTKALDPLVNSGQIVRRRRAGSFVAEQAAPSVADHAVETGEAQMEAMRHHLRRRIVMALRSDDLSAADLADRFDVPLSRLYHHMRILLDTQLIRVTRERQRRGTVQRFYRSAPTAGYILPTLSEDEMVTVLRNSLNSGLQRLEGELDGERLSAKDPDVYFTGSATVHASEDALRELGTILSEWIQRHVEARPGTERTNVTVAAFPLREPRTTES